MPKHAKKKHGMNKHDKNKHDRPREATAEPGTDYTQGFGSFDFFPYPSIRDEGRYQDGPLWDEHYMGRDRDPCRVFYPKPLTLAKTNLKTQPSRHNLTAPAIKEKNVKAKNAQKLGWKPGPFNFLPNELVLAILQPLVDKLRLRDYDPHHHAVPDNMGIHFLVSMADTRSGKQAINVMVDPRISLKRCTSCLSTSASLLRAPHAECTCRRRPEDYQALVALSQAGNRNWTYILGDIVWKRASVAFACPEALLLFAKQSPEAMARVQGITLVINLYALQNNQSVRHLRGLEQMKPVGGSPLAEMLDLVAGNRATPANPSPFTFFHVILSAGYFLPPSDRLGSFGSTRPALHPHWSGTLPGPQDEKLLERLVRRWGDRFHALPVQDGGFKLHVPGQDSFELNWRFYKKATPLWMPAYTPDQMVSKTDGDRKKELYRAEVEAYMRQRQQDIQWLVEKEEMDAKFAKVMAAKHLCLQEEEEKQEKQEKTRPQRMQRLLLDGAPKHM